MPRSTLLSTTAVLPSLRNLITPHAGLLLLRFRMGVMQKSMLNLHSIRCSLRNGHCSSVSFSTSSTRLNTHASPSLSPPSSSNPISISTKETTTTSSLPAKTSSIPLLEQIEPKISLTFTCTVSGCGERSTHQFTRRAYEKGIVLVQCPGCKNRYGSINQTLLAFHILKLGPSLQTLDCRSCWVV
jgi:mitochondrial protein import protein ZIM17